MKTTHYIKMIQILLTLSVLLLSPIAILSQVAINTDGSAPDNSAMLDVKSTTKGLLMPRMTLAQRNAIVNPMNGLLIYQNDNSPGYYYNAGTPANPNWTMVGGLTLPYFGNISYDLSAFYILNEGLGTGIYGEGSYGIHGSTNYESGAGVYGTSNLITGYSTGVKGYSTATNGKGVWGVGMTGVLGETSHSTGCGIHGINSAATGISCGVKGVAVSTGGIGVQGAASSSTGMNHGVQGTTISTTGTGVSGFAYATSGGNIGIWGLTFSPDGYSGYFQGGKWYTDSKVGIGTVNPAYKLHVLADSPDNWIGGLYNTSTNADAHGVVIRANGGKPLQVQGADGVPVLTIMQNGYTALSYFEPAYPLHVFSYYNPTWLVGFHNPSLMSTSNGLVLRADGGVPLLVQGNSAVTKFKVLQNGNIGIGDDDPDYRLVIRAPGTTSTGILVCRNSLGDNKVVLRQNTNGSGAVNIYETAGTATISLIGAGESYLNAGNVGIGTTDPGYRLQVGVAGDGTQARANAWNVFSDIRLKRDLVNLPNALELIDRLHGYYYFWNTGSDKTRQVGFSAQEVQQVLPEVVSADDEGYLSVDYGKITPLLLEAIKALKDENDQLKNRLLKVEAQLMKTGLMDDLSTK